MALLRVRLIQVRAEVIGGGGGGGRGHQRRVHALRQGPSAVTAGALCHRVRQHHPEAVLVVQGHALQEVVQQLRGYRRVNSRTAGHESVHVVHTLDVACGEPLTGLPVHGVHLCGEKHKTAVSSEVSTTAPQTVSYKREALCSDWLSRGTRCTRAPVAAEQLISILMR